jgi:hypothetical protein
MRLPSIERLLMMLSGVLFLPGIGWAQTATTGAIAGVVKDATGAVLPGVTVEAASPALIEKVRTVATDGEGQYKIVELRPGTYSVTFTLTGFSTVKRQGVELTAGFTAPVNAALRVGSLEETITVSGASPIVATKNARPQNQLSRELLDALPTHTTMHGFAVLWLVLAHVIFSVWGFARIDFPPQNWTNEYWALMTNGFFPGMIIATIGTVLVIAVAVTSLAVARRRLNYEMWYSIHFTAYAGIGA